jgi:hypothetical protein
MKPSRLSIPDVFARIRDEDAVSGLGAVADGARDEIDAQAVAPMRVAKLRIFLCIERCDWERAIIPRTGLPRKSASVSRQLEECCYYLLTWYE